MKLELEVRDYECDLQGIVNNAVYLQYFEHARHKFLLAHNIDFVALAKQGKNLVVREAQYIYHKSLRPDNKFFIETKVEIPGQAKLIFKQDIYNEQNQLMVSAKVTGACVSANSSKVFRIADILGQDFLALNSL